MSTLCGKFVAFTEHIVESVRKIKCVVDYSLTLRSVMCQLFIYVLFRLGYARITHGGLSDTELQIGRFRIPQDLSSFTDNEHITVDPQRVDTDSRFNSR